VILTTIGNADLSDYADSKSKSA